MLQIKTRSEFWRKLGYNIYKKRIELAEPAIRKAITVLDMLSRDPETVRLAELRMKKILDERSMLEGAREEGRGKGREEEQIQLILKQYRKGLSIDYIADINDFDIEYVKNVVVKS